MLGFCTRTISDEGLRLRRRAAPELVRKLNRKPIIRVEAGRFVGYVEDEQYVLGNIANGIVPAVQKMIRLRTEHSSA
jgi:hypothetical protein